MGDGVLNVFSGRTSSLFPPLRSSLDETTSKVVHPHDLVGTDSFHSLPQDTPYQSHHTIWSSVQDVPCLSPCDTGPLFPHGR